MKKRSLLTNSGVWKTEVTGIMPMISFDLYNADAVKENLFCGIGWPSSGIKRTAKWTFLLAVKEESR